MRVREWQSTGGQWVEREYTDDTILELFPDGDGSLVNPLLRRAQAAEAEIERLRGQLTDARAAALWLRIVLTNMTQGEQMVGVYERWPWLKGDDDE